MPPIIYISSYKLDQSKFVDYLNSKHKQIINFVYNELNSEGLRDALTELSTYPFIKETGVCFGPIEKFNLNMQNMILKFLEETPNNLQIFFYCQSKNPILPTIVSRVKFKKIDDSDAISMVDQALNEKVTKILALDFNTFMQKLLQDKIALEDFIEMSKIEKEELLFLLDKMNLYISTIILKNDSVVYKKRLIDILNVKKNLLANCQKKIALTPLLFN